MPPTWSLCAPQNSQQSINHQNNAGGFVNQQIQASQSSHATPSSQSSQPLDSVQTLNRNDRLESTQTRYSSPCSQPNQFSHQYHSSHDEFRASQTRLPPAHVQVPPERRSDPFDDESSQFESKSYPSLSNTTTTKPFTDHHLVKLEVREEPSRLSGSQNQYLPVNTARQQGWSQNGAHASASSDVQLTSSQMSSTSLHDKMLIEIENLAFRGGSLEPRSVQSYLERTMGLSNGSLTPRLHIIQSILRSFQGQSNDNYTEFNISQNTNYSQTAPLRNTSNPPSQCSHPNVPRSYTSENTNGQQSSIHPKFEHSQPSLSFQALSHSNQTNQRQSVAHSQPFQSAGPSNNQPQPSGDWDTQSTQVSATSSQGAPSRKRKAPAKSSKVSGATESEMPGEGQIAVLLSLVLLMRADRVR